VHSVDLSRPYTCPPTPVGPPVTIAHSQPAILDPILHTVVLISSISAPLSADLRLHYQSFLRPVFQTFALSVLKTRPAMVANEVGALLEKYATGFSYDGIRQAREEMIQKAMHSWVQIGLDCASAAKGILSTMVCERITTHLRDGRATSALCETLSDAAKLLFNQCLARANERIKELAQDHMIITDTHDHHRLTLGAKVMREQVFRGVVVSDNARTVGSEVLAYFDVSSGEFTDGCIRIILYQLMHHLSLQLSLGLLGALKLSGEDLPERCRMWTE